MTVVTRGCYRVTTGVRSCRLPEPGIPPAPARLRPPAATRRFHSPSRGPWKIGVGPKPYNCRRTLRTAHDPTLRFRIVRRNPDGRLLRPGAAQSLVCPGVRRGVRPRFHLRLSAGGVAFWAGGGGMVADRCAPLVVAAQACGSLKTGTSLLLAIVCSCKRR